ncbi:hypothetical protein, partial [Sphingobacterium rhinopitheci]|uniref:hypothetical protein n=1 Tax=Sphingobacterium rhinopitheci TaxID=2781960 RepID=UPI001F525640
MKTKFLLLLIASILVSCSNPLNISIVDELPDNVVSKYIAKDSLFDGFYKEVRLLVDTVYKKNNINEIKPIKYSDLYIINQTFNRERKALSNDQNLSNWLLEYEKDIKQFDIDSFKYTDYINQNDYNNYLSIEPFRVYEKADWLGVNIPTLDMNIEPLDNNKIRKIVGFVSLVEKGQKEDIFSYSYSNGAFFSNSDTFQKNFKLIAQDHSSGNSGLSNVINLPIEVIKQKYNFHFKITDLVVNDKYVDVL